MKGSKLVIIFPDGTEFDVDFPAGVSLVIVDGAALTYEHMVPSNGGWCFSILITGILKEGCTVDDIYDALKGPFEWLIYQLGIAGRFGQRGT